MPYIKNKERAKFIEILELIEDTLKVSCTPGDLNYLISNLVIKYVKTKGLNYTYINDVVGVLECVKAEFQRRCVAGYEDIKIFENGDL